MRRKALNPTGGRGAHVASAQTDLARLRVPTHQRLGSRHHVSAPDADGWRWVLPLEEVQHPAQEPQRQRVVAGSNYVGGRRPLPIVLHGKCLDYLSRSHRVATCRLPRRCLRCCGFGHLAQDHKWQQPGNNGGCGTAGGDGWRIMLCKRQWRVPPAISSVAIGTDGQR